MNVLEEEPNPTKVVRWWSTSKKMVACFFGNTGHMATVPLTLRRAIKAERYSTTCLPEVFGEDEPLFTMTMRALTHWLKPAPFWPKHRIYDLAPNGFFLFHIISYQEKSAWSTKCQQMLLKRSKPMFWRCLNRCGKSASTSGLLSAFDKSV